MEWSSGLNTTGTPNVTDYTNTSFHTPADVTSDQHPSLHTTTMSGSSITGLGLREKVKSGWQAKGKDGKSKESWRGDFKGIESGCGIDGKRQRFGSRGQRIYLTPSEHLRKPGIFWTTTKTRQLLRWCCVVLNQITPNIQEAQRQTEEEAEPKPPPVPFRADTTGLSTSHLPPPPGRKDGADGRTPTPTTASKPKPPSLPPRLPPRPNSNPAFSPNPTYTTTAEPDAHRGILNQGSLSRLAVAGVSVLGFDIETQSKPPLPQRPPSPSSPSRSPAPRQASASNASQLNELQSRFSASPQRLPNPKLQAKVHRSLKSKLPLRQCLLSEMIRLQSR